MKKRIALLALSVVLGTITLPNGARSQTSTYPFDGYIPHSPISCDYIKRMAIDGPPLFYYIESCGDIRGDKRQRIQEIRARTTDVPGVIYVESQSLFSGGHLKAGYHCSKKAPGWNVRSGRKICTEDGWKVPRQ